MNGFERFLAGVLNPGGRNSFGAASLDVVPPANSNRLSQPAPTGNALSNPGMAVSRQEAPVSAFAPQQAPMPAQQPQRSPVPRSGGGIGSFVGNLINPQGAARNQTVQWLQSQGMDEGTATLLAGNKSALQNYLLDRSRGVDPMDALKMQKAQLEIEQMRNPTTDDVREYQFAKQEGYEGTFTDFMQEMRSAGATNINVGAGAPGLGKLSSDYGYVLDPETGQPVIDPNTGLPQAAAIPGSPAAQEAQGASRAAENKEEQQRTWNAIVDQEIGRALDIMDSANLPTTGFIGDWLSGVGGTAARDLRGLLDTVKANAGFDRLQAMRDSSPTGGALGQVSERELAFLQSTIGNLEQSQTAEQLRFNLERLQRLYQNMLSGKRAYDGLLDESGGGGLPEGVSEEDLRYTMEKHGLSREEVLERLNAR